MASIRDVAQRAGVGAGTVSRVINESGYVSADTRKKIEQAIEELGYKPNELARNLFRNRTGIIGVLIPNLDHPFFSAFVREVEIALYNRGYKTMVCNTIGRSNREKDYLEMLDRNMVDGIITGVHTLDDDEYRNRKHTIVSLDRDFGPEVPMVGSDHVYGGKIAAEIFLKNNVHKVLDITGVAPHVAANDRHTILEKILREQGVEIANVVMGWNLFDHQTYWDTAKKALEEFEGVDGVFGADEAAMCYAHLAMRAGRRIPEDLKVITYDGMNLTRVFYPEVTSICQNVQQLAETCVDTVLSLVEGKKRVPHKQILSVTLQQGKTTYPVKLDCPVELRENNFDYIHTAQI